MSDIAQPVADLNPAPSPGPTSEIPAASEPGAPTVETSVFLPGTASVPIEDLPDSAFDPTPSEVGAAYAAATGRVQANSVLRTSAMRAKDEGVKVPKSWPTTKIRIKFSDRTQIERSFPSTSALTSVYDFVRSSLSETSKTESFMLYQPPRTNLPEHPPKPSAAKRPRINTPAPPPLVSLVDHGLAPSSVLLIRFDNDELNASDRPAPLLPALLSHAVELPLPVPPPQPETTSAAEGAPAPVAKPEAKAGGKMPKWFKGGKK